MNALMGRWVQTCRRELLDRTLIWNQRHLLHALREFEAFYNPTDPTAAWTAHRYGRHPSRSPNQANSNSLTSSDATGSAASSMSTNMPYDLHGRNNRHPQRGRRSRGQRLPLHDPGELIDLTAVIERRSAVAGLIHEYRRAA
jgi:hypothetical protein